MISEVLNHHAVKENPPVIMDIGASGQLHSRWKEIAEHSICIAFDADTRDFDYVKNENSNYKELYTFNCIVTDKKQDDAKFYLTKSPHCSSFLEPHNEALKGWSSAPLFEVQEQISIETQEINSVLEKLNINRIDWIKSDSQGIDLRLFKSIKPEIRDKTICAEFEPGFIDSYKEEDKLWKILAFMDELNKFWLADLIVKGFQRISSDNFNKLFKSDFIHKVAKHNVKKSPGWAEMIYLNKFNDASFTLRDYLLGWVFATVNGHNGFAMELAQTGNKLFNDKIFIELEKISVSKMKRELFSSKVFSGIKNRLSKIFNG